MKKFLKGILVLALSLTVILGGKMNVHAAGATLTGPSTVRAGDTITLQLNISDSGKYGIEGSLDFNSSLVTFSGMSANMSGWKAENNGNIILIYDDAYANPINGNKTVATFTFKVASNVAAGTKIDIMVKNLVATDGNTESNIGTATYSVTVARPLSSNANLSSLSVEGATLSPAFSSGTTSYSIGEVEFSTSKLNVSYKTEDPNAAVSVSGANLGVGNNTVSVYVKAENGATKTYTISVVRKQDPNYVASSNAALGSLNVSNGSFSPAFSADVDEYIVYLPYESVGAAFSASGQAADGKAQGVTNGAIEALSEGVNKTSVVCKAEDGTEKAYHLTVVVMPKYEGVVPEISGVDKVVEPEEPETEIAPETERESENSDDTQVSQDKTNTSHDNCTYKTVMIVLIVVLVLVIALAGVGAWYFIFRNRE